MKIKITVFTLLLVAFAFLSCSKDPDYYLDMQIVGQDTISVARDNVTVDDVYGTEEFRFNVNSNPSIYVDYITAQVLNTQGDPVPSDYFQTPIVSYSNAQSSVGVTGTVHAESNVTPGQYILRVSATNGKHSNSISYILNVL